MSGGPAAAAPAAPLSIDDANTALAVARNAAECLLACEALAAAALREADRIRAALARAAGAKT